MVSSEMQLLALGSQHPHGPLHNLIPRAGSSRPPWGRVQCNLCTSTRLACSAQCGEGRGSLAWRTHRPVEGRRG